MKRDFFEALAVGLIIFILTISNIFSPLDYMLKDSLYQIPGGIDTKIKIIGIDDKTLEELGPMQTWSRQVYADLLHVLNSAENEGPGVIAFDILFSGEVDEQGDRAFAKACDEYGNVVVASQFIYNEKGKMTQKGVVEYPIDVYLLPYQVLGESTLQGYTNISPDSDGIVRRIQPVQEFDGNTYDMFSAIVYKEYCRISGCETKLFPTDKYGKSLINYSGKPGDYECLSLVDVLNGTIDPRAFSDSIVLVGAYATGMQDNFKVPNGGNEQMFGVEIHANILQGMFEGDFSVTANPYVTGIITAFLGFFIHLLFKRKHIWLSAVCLIVITGLFLLTGVLLNHEQIAISLLYLPVVLVLSFGYCLVIGYVSEKLKRRKVLSAFKKYVAPEIVEELSQKGEFNICLGGENRDIAVLFVDIRGFTTMSEALSPEEVVTILNQYLNLTTCSIFKNKGTLDKFVGDATMAVFNAPFDLEDYEFKAVCAAMDIVEGGKKLEKELMEKFGRSVGFGVGVNCGPAVVGNIGCEFRMDYTAIGDTVNTAARLESNARKGQVLISDAVYERIKDRIEVEEVGEIPLKGKSKGVFVYSVISVKRV